MEIRMKLARKIPGKYGSRTFWPGRKCHVPDDVPQSYADQWIQEGAAEALRLEPGIPQPAGVPAPQPGVPVGISSNEVRALPIEEVLRRVHSPEAEYAAWTPQAASEAEQRGKGRVTLLQALEALQAAPEAAGDAEQPEDEGA